MVTRTCLSVTLCFVTITAATIATPAAVVLPQLFQNYRFYQATTNPIIISEDREICMCHVPIISLLPVLVKKCSMSLKSFRLQCSVFGTTPVLDGTK
jgi:hypothetical protein